MNDTSIRTASYPCPVCAATATKPRYAVNDLHIVECVSCGMIYVNPRVRNEDIFSLYRDHYFHRSSGSGYEDYELTAPLRIKTFRKWYDDCRPFLAPRHERALDIGCAAGYFLDLLREEGWPQVEGIELDKDMFSGLKARGMEVSDVPLEQRVPARRYHLITLFDVLEHLPDINDDFAKLAAMLDDDGIIALVTPDFNSFQRKLFGRRWFQFKPIEHIYYFAPRTLRTLAEKHGFEIAHLQPAGQYTNYDFLHHRLAKYDFPLLDKLFSAFCRLPALKNSFWYMDTGSMFAVLRKKEMPAAGPPILDILQP